MMPRLITGRIVWADVADPNGHCKLRPAIIVTPTNELSEADIRDVAGIVPPLQMRAIFAKLKEALPPSQPPLD